MASFSRKTSILGSLFIAVVLVSGAYLFSGSGADFFNASKANAESTQNLLKSYAQQDSDSDGLPDWEEALYGTDPHNAHSVSPTLTDGQAVAQGLVKPKFTSGSTEASSSSNLTTSLPGSEAGTGSMTDQFAQQLFGQYLAQADGTDPTQDQITSYAQSAVQSVVQNHTTQNAYTASNEQIQGTGSASLVTYAGAAETALAKNAPTATTQNEVDYFADAINTQSSADISSALAAIGKAYSADGPLLMATPVPVEAQYAHLELANALSRLGTDVSDMAAIGTDPLRAYLGLSAYQSDSAAMLQAFADMNTVFATEHVVIPTGQTGASFYNAISTAANQEAAVQTDNNSAVANGSPN